MRHGLKRIRTSITNQFHLEKTCCRFDLSVRFRVISHITLGPRGIRIVSFNTIKKNESMNICLYDIFAKTSHPHPCLLFQGLCDTLALLVS